MRKEAMWAGWWGGGRRRVSVKFGLGDGGLADGE